MGGPLRRKVIAGFDKWTKVDEWNQWNSSYCTSVLLRTAPYVVKKKFLWVENGSVRKCEADSHEWLLTPWPQRLHFCRAKSSNSSSGGNQECNSKERHKSSSQWDSSRHYFSFSNTLSTLLLEILLFSLWIFHFITSKIRIVVAQWITEWMVLKASVGVVTTKKKGFEWHWL